MSRLALACGLAISAASSTASATELEDAAASLEPGEWTMLETVGIDDALLNTGGASGFVFGFTEDIKWDPVGRQLFYVGSDHDQVDGARFIRYDESNNTWEQMPQESWMANIGQAMHGYDHSAIDAEGRRLWHRPFGSQSSYVYDIDADSWSSLPDQLVLEYNNCCAGVEYYPELGGLVWGAMETSNANLGIAFFADGASNWERLGDFDGPYPVGELHHFAEYNPVHGTMIIGGGNAPNEDRLYEVTPAGEIVALQASPVGLGTQQSIVTVDPGTGDYLIFANPDQLYVYDITDDSWTLQDGTPPIFTGEVNDPPVHGLVATPVSTFNVNLFVDCHVSNCSVHVYRHSNTPAPPPPGTTGDESSGSADVGDGDSAEGTGGPGDAGSTGGTVTAEESGGQSSAGGDAGGGEPSDGCGCRPSSPSAIPLLLLVFFARRRIS